MHDICRGGVLIQLTSRGLLGLLWRYERYRVSFFRLFCIYVGNVTGLGRKRGKEERCDKKQRRLGCCSFILLYVVDPASHDAPTKIVCLNTDHFLNIYCGWATRLWKDVAKHTYLAKKKKVVRRKICLHRASELAVTATLSVIIHRVY